MICKFCATGADVMSRVFELKPQYANQAGFEVFAADAIEVGKELHHHCLGKYACDCQHRTQEPGKNVVTRT